MSILHKDRPCAACLVVKWVVAVLLFLATIAAFVGMYKTHVTPTGLTFTTTQGALYLLAFSATVSLWVKHMKGCCKCGGGECCK